MPKASKSSASAGTRKKHAKKSGQDIDDEPKSQQPKQRGQKKLSKAQKKALPKVKQFIPPPKPPAPPIPDPLDGQGLARTLPAELVVVLRRLGKKDEVTRRKGLEDLREGWILDLLRIPQDGDDDVERELKETALLSAVPVWLHNLASLLQSPFHRSMAVQLHTELLSIPSIRTAVIDTLSLSLLPGTQNRDILGSWLVAGLEEGRRAGGAGLRGWEESTSWSSYEATTSTGVIEMRPQVTTLVEYFSLAILDPSSLYEDIHPAPVSSAPVTPPATSAKGGVKSSKGRAGPPMVTPDAAASSEEDELVAAERTARYRVGGLVGLAWLLQQLKSQSLVLPLELSNLIRDPMLWTCLLSMAPEQGGPSLGLDQAPIRRNAYLLLGTLMETFPVEVENAELLPILSRAALDSWSEKEAAVWEAAGPTVVKFLSKYRTAWELDFGTPDVGTTSAESGEPDDDDDEESDDPREDDSVDGDGDEDGSEDVRDELVLEQAGPPLAKVPETPSSPAFDNFLRFISTICPSIPHLTYPLLLVIISTIPDSLLPLEPEPSPQLKNLFAHLWAPVNARQLSMYGPPGQATAFQTFLRDAIDCTVFLIGRSSRRDNGTLTVDYLVTEQMGYRGWKEGILSHGGRAANRRSSGGGKTEPEADMYGQAVARVCAFDEKLATRLLSVMRETLLEKCFETDESNPNNASGLLRRSLPILAAVREGNISELVLAAVQEIIGAIASRCLERLNGENELVYAETLVDTIARYPNAVSENDRMALSNVLRDTTASTSLPPDLKISLFATFTSAYPDISRDAIREALWLAIDTPTTEPVNRFALAKSLLMSNNTDLLVQGVLDTIAVEATQAALSSGPTTATAVARSCLSKRGYLSDDATHTILALLATAIHSFVSNLLTTGTAGTNVEPALEIFSAYTTGHLQDVMSSEVCVLALVGIHHLCTIIPRMRELAFITPAFAASIWANLSGLPRDAQEKLSGKVFEDLSNLLGDVSFRVDPDVLVDVALSTVISSQPRLTPSDAAARLLPPVGDIAQSMSQLISRQPNTTLPLCDPLIPYLNGDTAAECSHFDAAGRSTSARYVEAILSLLRADRQIASSQPSYLRIVLQARALAQDALAVPGSSRGLFSQSTRPAQLSLAIREAEGALSYALASLDEVPTAWHTLTVQALKSGTPADNYDLLQELLLALKAEITLEGNDVSARAFRDVLSSHFRQCGAGEKEAEIWLNYAMTLLERSPVLSLPILLSIKPYLLESKVLETAQNRLANALTGIPAKQANNRGIPAIRLLIASAPPPDAAAVFLPQQRAMFVLRHLGSWLTSDDADDLSEEIEYRIAEVYTALAPIVQDLPGAHWDSIFDLVESGLESGSLDDPSTYCLLYQSLLLLQQIRDLCASNKALRATWTGKDTQMALVLKLFLQCREADSVPLELIQALLLNLLSDISEQAIAGVQIAELCELLRSSTSTAVQCTAYRILQQVIKRNTLSLVLEVEASVVEAEEGNAARTIVLPLELVNMATLGPTMEWHSDVGIEAVLGQLLSWMAILDHFDDASRTLRWAYLDQLNTTRLVTDGLLPMLFAMLGVSELGAWNFPASQYAVDEFYPDLLEPEALADLVPLASHIFYRSLVTIPSAMRTYYESLKDRQLSMSMLNFTAKNYSPVIIQHEFSALREPRAMALLTEEGLSVKIAQGGGATVAAGGGASEAIASYVVDEQPMEIGIRLHAEFPLKGVDVRDLRRVGVPENKWRGWLMSVQQTITSRNGLILEALTVFKKNVALHFEGVVECAICYSIISLTDRTLPTKPCRTCKNRFHASCLFKWFNSSHSSSCPLCRALF